MNAVQQKDIVDCIEKIDNPSDVANTFGLHSIVPQQMEMSVYRGIDDKRDIKIHDGTVALYTKELQCTVPDQVFSFENSWRTYTSRKQVACLILKVAFPEVEIQAGDTVRSGFGDVRVCHVAKICQDAEEEAFVSSSCHLEYEYRLKNLLGRLLEQKHKNLDMNRAMERWKNNRTLLTIMANNFHNDERGRPLLALPPPPLRESITAGSGQPSLTEPELSPIPHHGQNVRNPNERLGRAMMTSTPILESGSSRKRHFDPNSVDNHTSLLRGPSSKIPKLGSKKDVADVEDSHSTSSRPIIPPHLIKREIKIERPSPPSSPIPMVSVNPANASDELTCCPVRRRERLYMQNRKPKMWRSIFLPILNKIMGLNDSKQFKSRSERDRYHVTCFYKENEAITRPLDLDGVLKMMSDDTYMANPWNFITDVCWVFTLPTCTPRKNLKKQKCAKNLMKNFVEQTSKVMINFKYCCGRQYFYFPYDLVCVGREADVCGVLPYTKYYLFDNAVAVCEKCWNSNKNSSIKFRDKRTNEDRVILKSEFTELKNDKVYVEPMVTCVNCRRDYHKVCVQYLDLSGSNVYTCDMCLLTRGLSRPLRLKSSQLPTSALDRCIESRVRTYLSGRGVDNKVWVRVVSCTQKTTEIRRGMKELYVDVGNDYRLSESYPYRQKVIFAFEEIEEKEVAFFAMYVQEYGSDCPPPNTRRVYISYLDSVHYFQPKECRTAVYHEILLAYLQHTKSLGFTTFHIWACPPNEGNDYIFYAHPPEQKVPKAVRLLDWYKRMLEKGAVEGIVLEFKDMCRQVIDDNLQSVVQIPYLDGDFWPECFENTIKLMEQEKKQLAVVKRNVSKKKKGRAKKPAELLLERECENILKSDALSARIMGLVQTHKDLFFVAYLNPPSEPLQPIVDPDPITPACIADNRDALLENARENFHEFSTLRRAIFATQMLLKECTPGFGDRETYTCNHCGKGIDEYVISYTCSKCVDFDLCDSCLLINSHPHQMLVRGVDIQDEIPKYYKESNEPPAEEPRATKTLRGFVHAAQCHDVDCPHLHCHRLKALFFHTTQCRGALRGCSHCHQLASLVASHASYCTIPMPVCQILKCPEVKQVTRLSDADPAVVDKFRECRAVLSAESTFSSLRNTLNSRKLNAATNTNNNNNAKPSAKNTGEISEAFTDENAVVSLCNVNEVSEDPGKDVIKSVRDREEKFVPIP